MRNEINILLRLVNVEGCGEVGRSLQPGLFVGEQESGHGGAIGTPHGALYLVPVESVSVHGQSAIGSNIELIGRIERDKRCQMA